MQPWIRLRTLRLRPDRGHGRESGGNAVYVVEVTEKDDAKKSGDFTQQKQEVQKGAAAYANGAAYKVLNTAADVKDNRSNFY